MYRMYSKAIRYLLCVRQLLRRLTPSLQDIFFIATSSCARCLPGRRGYMSVSAGGGNGSRGRNGQPEDENRLIDQLDEEWDD